MSDSFFNERKHLQKSALSKPTISSKTCAKLLRIHPWKVSKMILHTNSNCFSTKQKAANTDSPLDLSIQRLHLHLHSFFVFVNLMDHMIHPSARFLILYWNRKIRRFSFFLLLRMGGKGVYQFQTTKAFLKRKAE